MSAYLVELLEARLSIVRARHHLVDFISATKSDWQTAQHHLAICAALERVERGETKRLIITMPPRHGKSEVATRRFPAWFLGRNPTSQVISTSYGADLAVDFGRDVRNLMRSSEYRRIFPAVTVARDSSAADAWHTTQGGIYVASGVGGAITGKGAHVALVDDPIKNSEEAYSARHREKIWLWYTSTLLTRLMPGGAIVVIATRWHEDDLTGRLLTEGGWEHLHLRAIETDNDGREAALWPDWFPLEYLRELRAKTPPRVWSALYQGDPHEETGSYYQRAWFERRYDKTPEGCHVYICSDYAVTEREDGSDPDFTEHGVFGLLGEDIYVLDWWHGQATADVWLLELIRLVRKWKPLAVFGEAGVIARAVDPLRQRLSSEHRVYWQQEWLASTADKAVRGQAMRGLAAMGRVVFGRQPWTERILSQLCRFPSAAHDDAFDAFSLLGIALTEAHPAIVRSQEKPRGKPDRYGRARGGEGHDSWKTV